MSLTKAQKTAVAEAERVPMRGAPGKFRRQVCGAYRTILALCRKGLCTAPRAWVDHTGQHPTMRAQINGISYALLTDAGLRQRRKLIELTEQGRGAEQYPAWELITHEELKKKLDEVRRG